jgi:hypothetical protein
MGKPKLRRLDLKVIQDQKGASAVLDPLRLRILEGLKLPGSASTLSREFHIPRQKINYHIRELEKHGFVEPVEERKKGNCVERIVRATARSYLISPETLGSLASDPEMIGDAFSASYLVALAAQTIQDLAYLRPKAEAKGKKFPSFTLQTEIRFASAENRYAFLTELSNTLGRLTAKYHDEKTQGGRLFRVFLGSYPAITNKDPKEKKS